MRALPTTAFLALLLGLPVPLPGQRAPSFGVALRDGTEVVANGLQRDGDRLVATLPAGPRALPLDQVLAIHGCAVVDAGLPAFHLHGGDVVRGEPTDGDRNGEWVAVTSPSLGVVRLPIDRLACVRLQPGLARPEDLILPDGAGEALFTRARLGFDIVTGALHQFAADGLRFQPQGGSEPRWFRRADLVGFRLADPVAAAALPFELLTRAGDRVGVELRSWQGGVLTVRTEAGAEVRVPEADLACLSARHGAGIRLTTLTPEVVDEAAWAGPPLYAWRRNESAVGGPLVAGGRTWASGLGVHSRSRLGFRVPPGAQSFWTRVGIDDGALLLRPRANVDVRILLDDRVVFAHKGLAAGAPVLDPGLLPVQPGALLVLEVDFGAGRDLADRVDWLLPVFLPAPDRQ